MKKKNDALVEEREETEQQTKEVKKSQSWLKRTWQKKRGKALLIGLGVLLLIAVLLAIPPTRYLTTSWFIKKQISFVVVNDNDGTPVSNAAIKLGDVAATTNEKGEVSLTSPVGPHTLSVTKKYYTDYKSTYTVPIVFAADDSDIKLRTNGRQLSFVVTDTITAKPVANVTITTLGTSAETDSKGIASVVVPVRTQAVSISLAAEGYNKKDQNISLNDKDQYGATITTAGYVYFLSKATGKIDVKKSHLDGTDSRLVLAGTGTETDYGTTLLSSRDWMYSALLADRDGEDGIYLINSSNDSMTTIDHGNAQFVPVGWNGHKFYYYIYLNNKQYWQSGNTVIKVYDADTDKTTIIDQNKTNDDQFEPQYQQFTSVYILNDQIFYGRYWDKDRYSLASGRVAELVSVDISSNKLTVVKTFPFDAEVTYLSLALYESQGVYVRASLNGVSSFYEYEAGKVTAKSGVTDQTFFESYPSYLVSPDGKRIFWYEPRDGKNYLFSADVDGKNEKTLASSSDYKTYGWFTDKYLLLGKNDSELYIAPADDISKPIKITDYHKAQGVNGYGYGYGGIY